MELNCLVGGCAFVFFLVVFGCLWKMLGGIKLSGWWLCVYFFGLCMVLCGMVLGGIELSAWWLCILFIYLFVLVVYGCVEWTCVEINCLVGGCVCVFFGCVWLCVEWFWVEFNCLVGGCVCLFLVVYGCMWNGSGWN